MDQFPGNPQKGMSTVINILSFPGRGIDSYGGAGIHSERYQLHSGNILHWQLRRCDVAQYFAIHGSVVGGCHLRFVCINPTGKSSWDINSKRASWPTSYRDRRRDLRLLSAYSCEFSLPE